MKSRPKSDDALTRRMLPGSNADQTDRALAWSEWGASRDPQLLLRYIRYKNFTDMPDEDIFQDTILTAYLEVENGRYQLRSGVPFIAYVKGIARNKMREARRKARDWVALEEHFCASDTKQERSLEILIEQRERSQALQDGLSKLPHQRRSVLERFLKGESTRQIARDLAMSEDLVRQHKSRGLRRLRHLCSYPQPQG